LLPTGRYVRQVTSLAGLFVAAGGTAAILLRGPNGSSPTNIALLLLAFAGLAVLVLSEARKPKLGAKLVLAVSGALLALAVVIPPTQSRDVYAYAYYGRLVSHYGQSPYTHSAAGHYPEDPFARRVDPIWRRNASVYGPVWTWISAAGTGTVARDSFLAARVYFQGVAAIATALALWLIWRRTRSPAAVAFLGVNPVIVISIVNGGHNDALVGLGILGGVLLLIAERPRWAAVVFASAVLVKVSALLPIGAVCLWVWRRHGFKVAATMGAIVAGVVLVGFALSGGREILAPLHVAQTHVSGSSVWWGPRRWMTFADMQRGVPGGAAGQAARLRVSTWGSLAALGMTLLLARRRLRNSDPALVAGAAVLAYTLLAAYVLPWYLGWGLPVMALAWRSRLYWLTLLHGAILQIAYLPDPTIEGKVDKLYIMRPLQRMQLDVFQVWMPLLEVLIIVGVVVISVKRPKWSLANVPVNATSHATRADATWPAPSSLRQPTST
jgi:alpha-1,6-mannosyltransferase